MDPNVTYQEMRDAYRKGRWDDAEMHATNLLTWIRNGGFAPKGIDSYSCMVQCDNVIKNARKKMAAQSVPQPAVPTPPPVDAPAGPGPKPRRRPCPFRFCLGMIALFSFVCIPWSWLAQVGIETSYSQTHEQKREVVRSVEDGRNTACICLTVALAGLAIPVRND